MTLYRGQLSCVSMLEPVEGQQVKACMLLFVPGDLELRRIAEAF